ncbi:hypothetical protein E4U14_000962 [Claviceps sp. LM454 group G7]|nr:hypothetical protein E4U14_000962 [Claviceps sp. LM454 group G7]
MDGEFVFVRTWQGSIMVSTSLLPRSFDQNSQNSSHSDSNHPYNKSRDSDTASRLQHRNSSHLVTATPPPPPPVPNFWHHRPHAASAGGNGVDYDENFFYTPSTPLAGTPSNSAQMYSPVYTPRTDDDAASIPDAYPSFSPRESVGSAFSQHSPGPEWGDAFVATDSSLFPPAQCYCSIPAMGLPSSAPGSGWSDDGKTQSFGHEQNFGLPLAWNECQGSAKTPNLQLGSMY